MNDRIVFAFREWLLLTDTEKAELAKAQAEYTASQQTTRKQISESYQQRATKLQTGSLGGACPRCGRS